MAMSEHLYKQTAFPWCAFAIASFSTIAVYLFGWSLASYYLWLAILGVLSCMSAFYVWIASATKLRPAIFIGAGILVGQWWFWQKVLHQALFRISGFAS